MIVHQGELITGLAEIKRFISNAPPEVKIELLEKGNRAASAVAVKIGENIASWVDYQP